MFGNPFLSSSERPPRSVANMARIVSGPVAAEAMNRIEKGRRRRASLDKLSQDFALTTDERVDLQEAQRFESLRSSESLRLRAFFGESFVIPPLPKEITPALKEFWERHGFVLEYWPKVHMSEDRDFPGWEHKPGKRYTKYKNGIEFFDEVREIQDHPDNQSNPHLRGLSPLDLLGAWVLKDTRAKRDCDDVDQVYENDNLFRMTIGSRNMRSVHDFSQRDFWNPLASALRIDSIPGAIMRLPRAIEANVMGQSKGFHDTNTYEWCEERYNFDGRLITGRAESGGASFVSWYNGEGGYAGCRPLVVFMTKE